MSLLQGAIAATRFGMGARPGEIAQASGDPRGWLKAQIRADAAIIPAANLLSTQQVFEQRAAAYEGLSPAMADSAGAQPDSEAQQKIRQVIQREAREGLVMEAEARSRHGAATQASFAERWARFWANHFTVAARNAQMIGLVGPFEREAIRPNVFGSFSRLLYAATFHPAMLTYLDASRSIGPSTQPAKRRGAGLNENLAREILELHTLGVGSGYTQADIIEFAEALTGWTIATPQIARLAGAGQGRQGRQARAAGLSDRIGRTIFLEPLHEPGARSVMGKAYAGEGEGQASAVLDDLAAHPATARRIATKLVRHFVADDPPPAAVARIETAFIATKGDLASVAAALVDLDDAWLPKPSKFKTPDELLVSVARSAGQDAAFGREQRVAYQSLAQQPYSAPSPAGWADTAEAWSGADALIKRLEWTNAVSRRMARGPSPLDFLDTALGPLAGERTRQAVMRAESAEQGFTLALMSPDFQRR